MYKRFHWDEKIVFTNSLWNEAPKIKKPSRIFVGSTMELFGDWIDPEWLRLTFEAVKAHPQHTFIFLTKQPQNLQKWSPFPENCWVGVSATNTQMFMEGMEALGPIEAKVKFVSFEPFLEWHYLYPVTYPLSNYFQNRGINWLIIGQQTPAKAATAPKVEWIREIVEAADKAGVPVFLKDNLKPLLKTSDGWIPGKFVSERECHGTEYLRQEFPNEK
jgi:protein gp37